MNYWYQKPHAAIAGYVKTVLILEGFSEADSSMLPLFANGMPALLYQVEKDSPENAAGQLTLFGKSVPPDYWSVQPSTTLIAYFFKPFALGCIFNIAARELTDKPIDAFNRKLQKTATVKTQLKQADSTQRKLEILDDFIGRQICHNQKECEIIACATDQIMCDPGTGVLSQLLKKLKLTERTFQRIFKRYVGITPSQYRRICQFYFAFDQLRGKQFEKLTDIAFENGYADQSHYIRSFREFTKITPNDYLKFGLTQKRD